VEQIKQILTRLLWLAVVLYTGYSLSQAVWRNIKVNQRISQLKVEISSIKQDNSKLADLSLYYQTDQFKEIELRRRLGYKRPEEQLVVLPLNFSDPDSPDRPQRVDREALPFYRKWVETITGLTI